MDQKTVEKLEGKIEDAIAEVIVKMGLKKLPLMPARQTMHVMAKAAVSGYEAVRANASKSTPIVASRLIRTSEQPYNSSEFHSIPGEWHGCYDPREFD